MVRLGDEWEMTGVQGDRWKDEHPSLESPRDSKRLQGSPGISRTCQSLQESPGLVKSLLMPGTLDSLTPCLPVSQSFVKEKHLHGVMKMMSPDAS